LKLKYNKNVPKIPFKKNQDKNIKNNDNKENNNNKDNNDNKDNADNKNKARTDNDRILSIDTGVVNTITMVTNFIENPNILDGRKLVAINMRYNRTMDNYKSKIKKEHNLNTSKHYRNMLYRKDCILKDYMHKISNAIIKYAKEKNIGTVVVGYNPNWKYKVTMGKKNNRTFYEIPFRRLLNMLFYKGKDNKILVVEVKESYTSKCDALSLESIEHHDNYEGNRKKRGLFKSSTEHCINADINGAVNILRKYVYQYRKEDSKKLENIIQSENYVNKLKNPKKTYYKSIHKQKTNETALKDEFLKNYLKKVKPENL
jgi:putative transposase